MSDDDLSLDQRLFLIENALSDLQSFGAGHYMGICVNAQLDDKRHPHWDDYHVELAHKAKP